MNRKVNELIPKAIEAISKTGIANGSGVVEKEYKGYISSMGASILQSGLIATLAFYSKNTEGSGAKRTKLLDAIFILIENNENNRKNETLLKYILKKTKAANSGDTVKVSELNHTKLKNFEQKISTSLVALKLALRTYKIIK